MVVLDQFGSKFEFKLPDSKTVFQTLPGAICSIICIVVMLVYAGYKLSTLVERSEYSLIQELYEFQYDDTFKFGQDDGFAIAASITDFDSSRTEAIEDPTVGTIQFYMKYWSVEQSTLGFKKIKSRSCNEADFNGSGAFWPLHSKFSNFENYLTKMKCIDVDANNEDEKYQIWGDYNSDVT